MSTTRLAPARPLIHLPDLHHPHRRRCLHTTAPSTTTRPHHLHHRPRIRASPRPIPPRNFTTSSHFHTPQPPDHYATLSISPTATPKEIKSAFYSLSKKHHPDVTRSLPESEATNHRQQFEQISEAYSILGDPDKKARYDSERNAAQSAAYTGGAPEAAQYSRGGRPASGLSRRRSTFRGPPPSFYRAGGWGSSAAAERRRRASEQTQKKQEDFAKSTQRAADGGDPPRQSQRYSSTGTRATPGEDDSSWPFTTDPNDVPHFDRAGHYRTTTNVEEQLRQGRRKRRSVLMQAKLEAMARGAGGDAIFPEEVGPGRELRAFFAVAGIVVFGAAGAFMFVKQVR